MKRFSVLLLCLISFSSLAANYYVATTGNNNNAGGSSTPWATLQHAADRVVAGDTVTVSNGTYSPFYISTSGTAQNNRITFVSQNKLGAIINGNVVNDGRPAGIHVLGNYITVDGFDVVSSGSPATNPGERGIRVSGSSGNFLENVILRNNRVTGAGWVGITTSFVNNAVLEYNECSGSLNQHGIYVANSGDSPTIRGNILHNNTMAGLHVNGDVSGGNDGIISNALIENNIIYSNNSGSCSSAINLDGVDNSIIRNNLIFNEPCQGISNFREDGGGASSNNKILNNTLVMAPASTHALKFRNGSINGYVRNNILIQQGSNGDAFALDADSMPGINSDYNIIIHTGNAAGAIENYTSLANWQNSSGQDAHSFAVTGTSAANILSKIFVNPVTTPTTADYNLIASSPAVDAGITLTDVSADINATPRPSGAAFDIGAYEYGASDVMPIPQNVTITKN